MLLSIHSDYLLSILPELVQGFKFNNFKTVEQLEEQWQKDVYARSTEAAQGRDTYPVVFPIKGAIIKHTRYGTIGTQTYIRWLKQIEREAAVSAIVFDIDSGGGQVSGTAEFAAAIRDCSKPTIAFTNGYMCSAAYHIAAAADRVVASPYADHIGSIGTMLTLQDFSAMFEKWGAKLYELYAPQSTEKNELWRELKEGGSKKTAAYLSEVADDFINTVKAYRPGLKDDQHVFKGATYTPEKAKAIGLVDEIMTLETLLKEL